MAGCRTAIKKAGDHHRLQTAEKLYAFNGVHLLEIDAEQNQTDSFKVKAMGAYACSNASWARDGGFLRLCVGRMRPEPALHLSLQAGENHRPVTLMQSAAGSCDG